MLKWKQGGPQNQHERVRFPSEPPRILNDMILGIDPSTRIIGYAFYDELSSKIELGHIKLQSDILQERYKEAAEQIKLLIKEKSLIRLVLKLPFLVKI